MAKSTAGLMSSFLTATTRATSAAMKTIRVVSAGQPAKVAPRQPTKITVRHQPNLVAVPTRPRVIAKPRNASFCAGLHVSDFGELRYKLYVPASGVGSLPLLVMLHGCGQTPDDFAKGTRMNALAEEMGLMVLYPAQARDANSNRCWNWFRAGDQSREAGEPAMIASLARHVRDLHGADPARIYVAGLSAGASAAVNVAHAFPDVFAAIGVHSGLPTGAAQDKRSAMMAMGQGNPGDRRMTPIPTIVFHGADDRVVNPRNGRFIAIRAQETYPALRGTELRREVPGGRKYIKTSYRVGRGKTFIEHWVIEGAGHAWSGGSPAGRFVDPKGPDASREMLRFFLRHRLPARRRTT